MKAQTKIEINKTVARKVLETVDSGLCRGLGSPEPGRMCVEAAVCSALGLPHSDDPGCVGAAVRKFKIRLNDASWSSNQARAAGMRKLAIAQLGSDGIDQSKFAAATAIATVRKIVPIALRAAAALAPARAAALETAAIACEAAASLAAAAVAAVAAVAAAGSAAVAWAAAAVAAAESAAAGSAAVAWEAAESAYDTTLTAAADAVLEVLIEMKSPGCKYLDLTEPQA